MADDDKKPPWGSDDEFNAQKAWDLIQKLRGETKAAKDDLQAVRTKLTATEGERDAARKAIADKENEGKSESDKVAARLADMEKQIADRDAKLLRSEVAAAKGLTPAQAKRLAGSTKEELESDADEILEAFPAPGGDGERKAPPSQQPRPSLRGGGDPTSDPVETDPAKLAASVPRL